MQRASSCAMAPRSQPPPGFFSLAMFSTPILAPGLVVRIALAAVKLSLFWTVIRGAGPLGTGLRVGRRLEYSSASVEASVVLRMSRVRDWVSSASAWRCCLFGLWDGVDMVFEMVLKMSQGR